MKALARIALAACLLWQGMLAAAMPIEMQAAQAASAAMPCHHADGKASSGCCSDRADCLALCAAPALPATAAVVAFVKPEAADAPVMRSERLPAHRFKPVRPPIPLSA